MQDLGRTFFYVQMKCCGQLESLYVLLGGGTENREQFMTQVTHTITPEDGR